MAKPEVKNSTSGGGTCVDLMTDDIQHEGWQFNVGSMKVFYVRGATWFKTNVLNEVTRLNQGYSDQLESFVHDINEAHPGWLIGGFNWEKSFAPRQAVDSLSLKRRKPIKFEKAVKTLYLCRLAASKQAEEGRLSFDPFDIYKKMRIEPAAFYIQDFDLDALKDMRKKKPKIEDELRERTGQISRKVFEEMAAGHTVTKRLADRTREALSAEGFDVGSVDYRYRDDVQRGAAKSASLVDDKPGTP